jgi:beta-N-acetylhexosaminidase
MNAWVAKRRWGFSIFFSVLSLLSLPYQVYGAADDDRKSYQYDSVYYEQGCDSTTAPAQTNSGGQTIVLDPGHSPQTSASQQDSHTGLFVQDYANDPEMANAFTAAKSIESRLKKDNYNVVLTKSSANDTLDLGERAKRINDAKGALVVTLHSSPGIAGFLMYPDSNSHRTPKTGRRLDGTTGLVHPDIEGPSKDFAQKMAPIIAQGIGNSGYVAKSFNDEYGANGLLGNGLNSGNTPVQTILTAIPAVYSEVEQSVLPSDKFADAMTKAIEAAVPASSQTSTSSSTNSSSSTSTSAGSSTGTSASGNSSSGSAGSSTSTTSSLSADQKFSATFLIGFDAGTSKSTIEAIAKKYKIGGIYILGTQDAAGAGFNKSFADKLKQAAGHPVVIASDEESQAIHRFSYPFSLSDGPSMAKMSDSSLKDLTTKMAKALSGNGVNTDLAPIADVSLDSSGTDDGTSARAFSNDPKVVADKAGAFADGLQAGGVHPTFKHFPGLGGIANANTDARAATSAPLSQLENRDLKPYETLAKKNGAAVMMDNAQIPNLTGPGEVAGTSAAAVSLLRAKYSFSGLIMTDALESGGVGKPLPDAVAAALKAGVDMPIFNYSSDGQIDSAIASSKSAGVNTDKALQHISDFLGGGGQVNAGISSQGCCGGSTDLSGGSNNYIPAGGKDVGASYFTDPGGYHGDSLGGTWSYAELGYTGGSPDTAQNLGGLKYKQKLAITYKGKTVVAEKLDIGTGGGQVTASGKSYRRDIDLYSTVSDYLGLTSAGLDVVHVQLVGDSTPLGPVSGGTSLQDTGNQNSVNGTPNNSSAGGTGCCNPTSDTLSGKDNESKAYNFFIQKGLSPAQAAGVVANLVNESGVDPQIDGPDPNHPNGKDGPNVWGVAQWTGASLTQGYIADKARNHIQGDDSLLQTQLEVLWAEMNGQSAVWGTSLLAGLKAISGNSPDAAGQAAIYFRDHFERCDTSVSSCADRASVGASEFKKLVGNNPNASSGSSGSSTASGTGCGGGSTDCTSASGNAKILCEAKKYAGIYYEWSGGHQGYAAFKKACTDPSNPPNNQAHGGPVNGDPGGLSGNPSPCGLDCSGLVSVAVDDAFKQSFMWTTTDIASDSANWKQIPLNQVQPGDAFEPDSGHVVLVDHVSGGQIISFESKETGVKIGPGSWPLSGQAFRYVGPGHG